MIYRFNHYSLDTTLFCLLADGKPVAVEPQVFNLLEYLIVNRERVVTRDELLQNLWKGKIVTDAALGVRLKDARKAVGDNGREQSVIKTVHGRGYQFIAPLNELDETPEFEQPITRYAQNGEVGIAYQVFGDGPRDLIFIPGWLSNLDLFWEQPRAAAFFTGLAGFCRVILIDRRGTGLSERVAPPTLDLQMQDILAVMTAVGSKRAALMGTSEGGNICVQFGFSHPRRVSALILVGTAARWVRNDDYRYGPSPGEAEEWIAEVENNWGGPVAIDLVAPSLADDEEFRTWLSKYFRSSASKSTAIALLRQSHQIDSCPILGSVEAPTLVLQANGDLVCPPEAGRELARRMPNARLVEQDTRDHAPYVGCPEQIVNEVESFLERL